MRAHRTQAIPGFFQSLERSAAGFSNPWKRRAGLALLAWAACAGLAAADTDTHLNTGYRNRWFTPSPNDGPYSNYFGAWPEPALTNASTPVYMGHMLGNSTNTLPVGGGFGLPRSAFGQPVEGLKADVFFGQPIPPPLGANSNVPPANFAPVQVGNNAAAYYECQDPVGGAFWSPSTKQVIAAQANNVEIHWRMTNGTTNVFVTLVGAVPLNRPARLFWTESPYDAPMVNLYGLFPVIHYNSEVTRPVYQTVTNVDNGVTNYTSNVVSGVWLDDQKKLHATEVSGMFVLEYYETGTYNEQVAPAGLEIVQVMQPDVIVQNADIGTRLLPQDSYWSELEGTEGLDAYVSAGVGDTAYQYEQVGPKQGWVYAVKRTDQEPWSLEIYWRHAGLMGVFWPFEYDWYACNWPAYPQVRVLGDSTQNTAEVIIPGDLTAELMDYMEPPLHAQLAPSGKSLMSTEPGFCLMKYTTHDDIWFDVLQSVSHTNRAFFDLTPIEWTIGEELRSPGDEAHALLFDGTNDFVVAGLSWLNKRANWTLSCWIQPGARMGGTIYGEAIVGPTFEVSLGADGSLYVATWNAAIPGEWVHAQTPAGMVGTSGWHYVAATLENGEDTTNGTLTVYVDGTAWSMTNFCRLNFDAQGQCSIGAATHWPTGTMTNFFNGWIDEVHIWNEVLDAAAIWSNRYELATNNLDALIVNYAFDEGIGDTACNEAGSFVGTLHGPPTWGFGQIDPLVDYSSFPGYIYEPYGNRYNVDLYDYPTEDNPDQASYCFAVNEGPLEVWWANRSRQEGMPAVYYPSWVNRYQCVWPTNAPQIVIASGLGSNGDQLEGAANALAFDGVNDVAVVPHNAFFDLDATATLEAWIRPDSLGGVQDVVSTIITGAAWGGFTLGLSNDACCARFYDDEENEYTLNWSAPPTGVWSHVAVTYAQNGLMAGYLNGRLVAQRVASASPLKPAYTNLMIGRGVNEHTEGFHGRIGEVRVWNEAREASQIFGGWLTRPQGTEEGLVAYYPFTRGTNEAVLVDGGTNGLNGAIDGASWVEPGRPVPASSTYLLADDSIYVQNNANLPGYNPNEEQALVVGGTAYALRDDLNTPTSSRPFVLVDYVDPQSGRPKMALFGVVRTNAQYGFAYPLDAGLPIIPPMPLGGLPLCVGTYSSTMPPAWRDRKDGWWACSAGDDGGTTNALMHFFYTMEPGFFFPKLGLTNQPAPGTELPWLPTPFQGTGTGGVPVEVVYTIDWPETVPEIMIGQTLTYAANGLPDVWDQLSVESIYQQSQRKGLGDSVILFDPVVEQGVDLSNAVIQAMTQQALAQTDLTDGKTRFGGLPPTLYPRLYYDPSRGSHGQLVLEGLYRQTLTGGGYLLLNLLEDFEKQQARAAAAALGNDLTNQWNAAVNALTGAVTRIQPNTPYVQAAAYAGLGNGTGYVTLAFNNSTNGLQVPPALPVSLNIIQVVPELYEGMIEVLEPADPLDEQLSLHYSPDFAGRVEDYEFDWRVAEPIGGLPPNDDYDTWLVYGTPPERGSNDVTIAGASPFTLADHYFAVAYRKVVPHGPTGTNWSPWSVGFAPGWVQRVMDGINPFDQCMQDTIDNAIDTRITMIGLAGPPYQGDIALNLEAACDSGLIPVYRTVLNRAENFSIRAGLNDSADNDTLLFAATRLHDLYMLLGNEAYADAQDPTIAFPRALYEDEHGADATSIFCFMNQMPSLIEEELALLRGRDDTLEPSVELAPVYNRLIWNFTQGINGGEPAYAYSYNIRTDPTGLVGSVITAEDAARLYPQGHGDAWGHYLSALSVYYELLGNTNFVWHTTASATLVGNADVSVDYFNEQKFAEAAANRARTGVEVVNRVYRKAYSEDPTCRWADYLDSNTNRAWGMAGWAARAGQASYYDWAVANSLLLDHLTNMVQVGGSNRPPEGIEKIDRTTVPELYLLAGSMRHIQQQLDNADGGLNPLGLARDVVPFDISPTEIDAGQTHFEQIYDRALQAVYNACIAFDYARNVTLKMRDQFDSVYDLQEQLVESEIDFHNELVELYGYPYPDDCGPGCTYPQGYDGPDLVNWSILDLEDFIVNAPTGQTMNLLLYTYDFNCSNSFYGAQSSDYSDLSGETTFQTNVVGTSTVSIAESGLRVKPASWTGSRTARGELQIALTEMIREWYALQAKLADYNRTMAELEVEILNRQADYERYPNEWYNVVTNAGRAKTTAGIIGGLTISKEGIEILAELVQTIAATAGSGLPAEIEGVLGVYLYENVPNVAIHVANVAKMVKFLAAHSLEIAKISRETQQARWEADLQTLLADNNYQYVLKWSTLETEAKIKEQFVKQAEIMEQVAAIQQMAHRVVQLKTKGELTLVQRAQVRARAAQRIQMNRYQDLCFRIFREDALRRYNDTFDLAARYVYLAAKAYDYETGLLGSDTELESGSRFFEDIVKARLPGRFYEWLGEPEIGIDEGDPGLADIMARMKANWNVLDGRFGFNNPDTETSRFSLRAEQFRVSPLTSSDGDWAKVLEDCKVDDLRALPEYARYCIPFSDSTNAEPALVIPFSTCITAGKNYFGHDLAGGDNAYDPTHQATKVRSAGIWFTGYNVTYNTNYTSGGGLANEPRVYLIPVGEDVMRSPTRDGIETRSWRIVDQALPLPYDIGGMDIDNYDFQPIYDSLNEPLAQIRRFASLRAYHDRGQFDEAETHNNGRLIGRSVWNTQWLLIIPGRTLLGDPEEGIERFIHGALVDGERDGNGIKDVKIFFQTYSIAGE